MEGVVVMNYRNHFKAYNFFILVFSVLVIGHNILCLFIICPFSPIPINYLPAFYASFFIMNPDIDLLFGKHQTNIKNHRSYLTHSGLFPIIIYWCLHPFLNMDTAKMFGLVLFLPILVHLIGDYKANDIFDENEGQGSWKIMVHFFGQRQRFNKAGSVIWVTINNIGILSYAIWIVIMGLT